MFMSINDLYTLILMYQTLFPRIYEIINLIEKSENLLSVCGLGTKLFGIKIIDVNSCLSP